MALSNNVQGRQFDSYTQVTDGTALRVVTAPDDSATGLVYTTTTGTVDTTAAVLIEKQELNGRGGSWFVYNADTGGKSESITVNMYAAYASGASNWSDAGAEWDVVGSDIIIAAGATKHIPFNNKYRYVALTAATGAQDSEGVVAYLYALN
tara:strand:+ start:1067 stop:1519 length:453 start_codon:yes stop_codon:yes gene_type:complete